MTQCKFTQQVGGQNFEQNVKFDFPVVHLL